MRARDALVALDGVTCAYRAQAVVTDASFVLDTGSFVGVVGPSGSGKTTLLRAMLGTIAPVRGCVRRRPGLRLGYVPQTETVDWSFPVTVRDVVLMARTRGRVLPWSSRDERREVDAVLERLGIPSLGHRHIRDLSGGQQQRVFLARALFGQPDLLLLDEPTSGIDVRTRHEVLHLLEHLHAEGLAIVLTTHDLNGIASHLPRVVCLNVEVVADGAPEDVLTPEVLERTYGAPMEVLEHGGMRVVVDRFQSNVVALRRRAS
jgi:ABC-type Mn2+/Zn2+ transport system ATPase subunit